MKPSWGSLIYLVVLGVLTPIIYFGYNVMIPLAPFIHPGDILYELLDVKVELALQFSMAVLWVSGTLAYFEDMGGRSACQFDSYYHYAMPDDFDHVCNLRELLWKLCWAAFALQAFLFLLEVVVAAYIFLFLDQEVLNEPHYTWGRRAYDFQKGRKLARKSERAARAARAGQRPNEKHGFYGDRPYYDRYPAPYHDDYDYPEHNAPGEYAPDQYYYDDRTPDESFLDDRSMPSRSATRRSRASARRGQAYSAGAPSERGVGEKTPYYQDEEEEEDDDGYHEAGPYAGHGNWPHRSSLGSNRERDYGGVTLYDDERVHDGHDDLLAPTPVAYPSEQSQGMPSALSNRSRSMHSRAAGSRSGRSSGASFRSSRSARVPPLRRTSTGAAHRRGQSYASASGLSDRSERSFEEERAADLPALGSRGRRAYLEHTDEDE